jgi:hypothetical protein
MVQGIFIAIETRVTSEAIWLAGVTYIVLLLSTLYSVVLGGLYSILSPPHTQTYTVWSFRTDTDLLFWFLL